MIFEIDFKGNTTSEVTMRRSWALTRESGELTFRVYTVPTSTNRTTPGTAATSVTMKFKTNVWYHLTFTATVVTNDKGYDRTELKMYVNSRPMHTARSVNSLKKGKFDRLIIYSLYFINLFKDTFTLE